MLIFCDDGVGFDTSAPLVLDNLIKLLYQISPAQRVRIQTFGGFDLFVDGVIVADMLSTLRNVNAKEIVIRKRNSWA